MKWFSIFKKWKIFGTHSADLTPLGVKTLALLCPPPSPPSPPPPAGAATPPSRDGVRIAKSFPSSLPLHPRAGVVNNAYTPADGRRRFFHVCTLRNPLLTLCSCMLRSAAMCFAHMHWLQLCISWREILAQFLLPFLKCFKILWLSFHSNFVTGNACECGMQVVMQKKGWYICRPGSCVFANNINYAFLTSRVKKINSFNPYSHTSTN